MINKFLKMSNLLPNLLKNIWPIGKLDFSKSTTCIHINSQKIFLLSAIISHIIFLSIIITACSLSFNCSEFLPTISYIGFFRGYDRTIVLILSTWTPILLLFFSVAYTNYDEILSRLDSLTMLFMGILISAAVPFVGVIDEVASSFYVFFEKIHLVLMVAIISLALI